MTSMKPTTPARSITRERHRAAAHLLDERPEDVAAVERQEREQVDDRRATARSPRAAKIASPRVVRDRLVRDLVDADDAR